MRAIDNMTQDQIETLQIKGMLPTNEPISNIVNRNTQRHLMTRLAEKHRREAEADELRDKLRPTHPYIDEASTDEVLAFAKAERAAQLAAIADKVYAANEEAN